MTATGSVTAGLWAEFVDVFGDAVPVDEFDVAYFELGCTPLGFGRPQRFALELAKRFGDRACQQLGGQEGVDPGAPLPDLILTSTSV